MNKSNAKTFLCAILLFGTLNFTFMNILSYGSAFLRLFEDIDNYNDIQNKRTLKSIIFKPVHRKLRLDHRRRNGTEKDHLPSKNSYGTIGTKTDIAQCRILKDLKVIT